MLLDSRTGAVIIVGGVDSDGAPVLHAERFDLFRTLDPAGDTAALPEVEGCRSSSVADDGRTVAMLCDQPPPSLGMQVDDLATSEAIVVDGRTGAMWCVSCKGTEALGASSITLTGDGRAALMGSRGAFDSFTVDEQERAWRVDLTPGEPVSRYLLSTNVVSGIRGPLALASRSPSYALATAWFDGDVIQVGYQRVDSLQGGAFRPPYGQRLAVAFDAFESVTRVAVRASSTGESPDVTIVFDVPLFSETPPVGTVLEVPSKADDPSLSPNGGYAAVFAAVFAEDGEEVDLYRVTLNNENGEATVTALTLDMPNPCVIGETCTPPSVDDNGDVVWATSDGALIHTSTQGGTPTHTSLLPAGVTGRLPALSSNGRFVTYTSSRTDLAGSGADRVFVADAPPDFVQ